MTAALVNGGREHFGWGHERHLAADIYDALNVNTRATGNWGKKPPKFPLWPRPGTKKAAPEKVTVAMLFNRMQSHTRR